MVSRQGPPWQARPCLACPRDLPHHAKLQQLVDQHRDQPWAVVGPELPMEDQTWLLSSRLRILTPRYLTSLLFSGFIILVKVVEMKLTVEGLEKERDFYFGEIQ